MILRSAFVFDEDGGLAYDTIVYSCPKKSGKTTINAAVALWWAFTHKFDEIFIVANDLDQAQTELTIRLRILRQRVRGTAWRPASLNS